MANPPSKARKLVRRLLRSKAIGGAPHLSEFVECLVREFGGAEAAAKEMKKQYEDAPKAFKLSFWRLFMKQVEVNTTLGGVNNDFSMASDEDLERELLEIMSGRTYAIETEE